MMKLYQKQNKELHAMFLRKFDKMIRKLRSKRDFECSKGERVYIKAAENDGVMVFFLLYMIHADRSSTHRVNLRNKLEHCPGLFISGNVNQMIDRMVPICEEAQRFNVTADYDISVKQLATILVKRSTFFQPLMAKFVMDVDATMRTEAGAK